MPAPLPPVPAADGPRVDGGTRPRGCWGGKHSSGAAAGPAQPAGGGRAVAPISHTTRCPLSPSACLRSWGSPKTPVGRRKRTARPEPTAADPAVPVPSRHQALPLGPMAAEHPRSTVPFSTPTSCCRAALHPAAPSQLQHWELLWVGGGDGAQTYQGPGATAVPFYLLRVPASPLLYLCLFIKGTLTSDKVLLELQSSRRDINYGFVLFFFSKENSFAP